MYEKAYQCDHTNRLYLSIQVLCNPAAIFAWTTDCVNTHTPVMGLSGAVATRTGLMEALHFINFWQ